MSTTPAALVRALDEKATKGPLRCEYDSCDCGDGYGCSHGSWVCTLRGPDEPVSAGGHVRGWNEVAEIPGETWEVFVALRNALPSLAALLDAAEASNEALVRAIGGRSRSGFSGKEIPNEARAMAHVTAYDAARAAFMAQMGGSDA